MDNVIDPTNCAPYSTASGDPKRVCPKTNLVDVKSEIRRSLLVSFTFSNPDDNYKVLLSEGSKEIWEIDYVKDGELRRAAGKVRNFEYWTNKHIGLSTYSANGVVQRDEKVVVKFDASIDFKQQLISIDVRNIRGLKPAGVIEDSELIQDSSANFIKVSKNAYSFLKVSYPNEYSTLLKVEATLNTDDTEYTDFMFDGALAMNELAPLNLTKVKSANFMFKDNENLPEVQLTTSDTLVSAKGMFERCLKLNNVEITTTGLQNAEGMFKNCKALGSLSLNVSALTNAKDMFYGATALTTLKLEGELKTGIDFTSCPLSEESIVSVLTSLSSNGPDENKIVTFTATEVNGAAKYLYDAAVEAGWTVNGLTFTEAPEEELALDLVNDYNAGKEEASAPKTETEVQPPTSETPEVSNGEAGTSEEAPISQPETTEHTTTTNQPKVTNGTATEEVPASQPSESVTDNSEDDTEGLAEELVGSYKEGMAETVVP